MAAQTVVLPTPPLPVTNRKRLPATEPRPGAAEEGAEGRQARRGRVGAAEVDPFDDGRRPARALLQQQGGAARHARGVRRDDLRDEGIGLQAKEIIPVAAVEAYTVLDPHQLDVGSRGDEDVRAGPLGRERFEGPPDSLGDRGQRVHWRAGVGVVAVVRYVQGVRDVPVGAVASDD